MRLLVTGGMGFIGSNFIRHMLAGYDDITIINLDRLSYGSNPAGLKDVQDFRDCRSVKRSINDLDLAKKLAADLE